MTENQPEPAPLTPIPPAAPTPLAVTPAQEAPTTAQVEAVTTAPELTVPVAPSLTSVTTAPRPSPRAGLPLVSSRRLIAAAAAVALALAGGVVGGLVGYRAFPNSGATAASSTTAVSTAPILDRSSLAGIAAAVAPAVVDITTNVAEGSGVVIASDGYIVTNNHVLEGARDVIVTFSSGDQADATIVGTDAEADIAVLHVDRDGLVAAQWGDSDNVLVGDTVLAMGSPLGLQGSVTAGIVSALHREITVGDGQQQTRSRAETIEDAIQTDAPINSGNSGGALVNTNGEVIGINTAIATAGSSGNLGVGFAIAANTAKAVVADILAGH